MPQSAITPTANYPTQKSELDHTHIDAAVELGLHDEFVSTQQLHVLGTAVTGPAAVWLLWDFGQSQRLLLWLAVHLVMTALLGTTFHHVAKRERPYPASSDPVRRATILSGIAMGSIVWFDRASLASSTYAFGLCACLLAFSAGCFVNLHPLAHLIRFTLFPMLLQVAAALLLAGQTQAAACVVVFLAIVGLKPLCVIRESFEQLVTVREQATWNAQHDPMTGLLNRAGLHEAIGGNQTMLYIDLDGFKAVNDRHGHSAGDKLLCESARRIVATTAGSGAAVARLGGDEFLVLLPATDRPLADKMAGAIVAALSEPFSVGEPISASIGLAFTGIDSTATTAIDRADRALYAAKANADQRIVWHGLTRTATPPVRVDNE